MVQTQITALHMRNPLDLSEVTDPDDRGRIEHVDRLFCSFSDELPMITKQKVKFVNTTHYRITYDWDDAVFTLSIPELCNRFKNLEYLRDYRAGKQGITFFIWSQSELESQGISSRPKKRAKTDDGHNDVD